MPEPTGKEPSSATVPDNRGRPETRTEVIGEIFHDEPPAAPEPDAITEPSEPKEPTPPEKTEPEKTAEPPAEPEKTPETPPKTEEYSEEKYREAYGEVVELRDQLKDGLASVEKQKEEMRKYFTEQTEKAKALRQELGVDEAHKVDKEIGKDMGKIGQKPATEFVQMDYLTDDIIKRASEHGLLRTKQEVAMFTQMKPMLNALLNSVAYNTYQRTTSMVGDLKGEITPIVQSNEEVAVARTRAEKWGGYIGSYESKYGKPTDEQLVSFMGEIKADKSLQALVDNGDEEAAHTAMRRIMHDPGAKSLLSFKAPPPPVLPKTSESHSVESEPEPPPPAEPLTPMGKRQKQQRGMDKAIDTIFGDK